MRLLVYREHSREELRRKLQTRFPDTIEFGPALDALEERGYLSDERFVVEYLASRKRKGFGPLRIEAELRDRGIGRGLINRYLVEDDTYWYRLMQDVAASKVGESTGISRKTQQKTARFLEYRGFPAALIRRYLWDDE